MVSVKVGIVGGTGLQRKEMFVVEETKAVSTPFGKPSSSLVCGKLHGIPCVLLSRHGEDHSIIPSNINYRANVFALKQEGCNLIIATTACGSLKEEVEPGQFVMIDQFIDRTTKRVSTYYNGGENDLKGVCHIPMRSPYCVKLRNILSKSCQEADVKYHDSGTVVAVEGPRFSTFAESCLFRSWGASIINMTAVPEVVLANELGILYASIAMVTDYDCWKSDHESVNVENVLRVMKKNGENVSKVIASAVKNIGEYPWEKEIEYATAVASGSVL